MCHHIGTFKPIVWDFFFLETTVHHLQALVAGIHLLSRAQEGRNCRNKMLRSGLQATVTRTYVGGYGVLTMSQ